MLVFDVGNTVDEDDVEGGLLGLIVNLKLSESLGNLFFEIGWLLTSFLNDLVSSVEHV